MRARAALARAAAKGLAFAAGIAKETSHLTNGVTKKGRTVALQPSNPDVFMREVDDAVRADRVRRLFVNFGRPLAALVIFGLIAFGGWLYWQSYSAGQAGERGRQFSAAIDTLSQNRPKAASAEAEPLTKSGDQTYRALALMLQGNAAQAQNQPAIAAARFGAVANDSHFDPALRHVALLRQTLVELDTLPPASVIARLRGLVAEPGPAFASAAELTALAELKRGNDRAAGLLYKRIAEAPGVPDTLKSRAVQMAGMLGVDAVDARQSNANNAIESAPAAATNAPNGGN